MPNSFESRQANSFTRNIELNQFTMEISEEKLLRLEIIVHIDGNKIWINKYSKTTN